MKAWEASFTKRVAGFVMILAVALATLLTAAFPSHALGRTFSADQEFEHQARRIVIYVYADKGDKIHVHQRSVHGMSSWGPLCPYKYREVKGSDGTVSYRINGGAQKIQIIDDQGAVLKETHERDTFMNDEALRNEFKALPETTTDKSLVDAWNAKVGAFIDSHSEAIKQYLDHEPFGEPFVAPKKGIYRVFYSNGEATVDNYYKDKVSMPNKYVYKNVAVWTERNGVENFAGTYMIKPHIEQFPEDTTDFTYYVLTNTGARYKVEFKRYFGWSSSIQFSAFGILDKKTGEILRSSSLGDVGKPDGFRSQLPHVLAGTLA